MARDGMAGRGGGGGSGSGGRDAGRAEMRAAAGGSEALGRAAASGGRRMAEREREVTRYITRGRAGRA